jgi:hypothetical protein
VGDRARPGAGPATARVLRLQIAMIGAAADLPELVSRSHTSGGPWPDSSSKQSQAPRSAAALYHGPGLVFPRGDGVLVPLGRPAGRDLHAPPDPVPQHIQPGQRVVHPNRSCTSSPIRASVQHWSCRPRRPGRHPAPPPARAPAPGQLAPGPRPRSWRPAPVSCLWPAPAATGSPTSAIPEASRDLPVAHARRC